VVEWATDLVTASHWTYVFILAIAALDAVLPVVPSETVAIAAGVLAGAGELSIVAVIGAAAVGAFSGDNGSYVVGRSVSSPVTKQCSRGRFGRRCRAWAARVLAQRGYVIVVSRFIPGGRTATTLTAGVVRMPWRTFAMFAAVGATLWASYAGLLGYLGGRTFEEHPWQGVLAALALAAAIALAVEIFRSARERGRARVA
jgi:membrane-associated protein